MPDILYGLSVDDFSHPDDLTAMKALQKSATLDKLISFVEDKSTQVLLQTQTLGRGVRITKKNNEKLYSAVQDTCEILEYDRVPDIYTSRSFKVDVTPHGVENPVICIPDFVAETFDDSLLHFTVGRAITRLKSGHMKFYIAANAITLFTDRYAIVSEAVKVPLANWMRKSELTADRGGLLACQSFHTAMKFMMFKAGMPFAYLDDVDEYDYIKTCSMDDKLVNASKKMMTLSNVQGWSNDRILELYNWYSRGEYDELLDEHLD